jgi:hypothetical protein
MRFPFLAVAGGAGILGGALLMEGFEHHERREEERAYDQGLDQGYDQGQLSFMVSNSYSNRAVHSRL